MAISRQQIVKELLPGLNKLFGDEYAKWKPIDMDTFKNKKYSDVKNKAFIGVSVDTLLGLWMSIFPDGLCPVDDVSKLSEDMLDVGRVLRDEGILKYRHSNYMYYIEEEFR